MMILMMMYSKVMSMMMIVMMMYWKVMMMIT